MTKTCGLAATYRSGCRCEPCKLAHNARIRKYYQKRQKETPGWTNKKTERRSCERCGTTYLVRSDHASKFCGVACAVRARFARYENTAVVLYRRPPMWMHRYKSKELTIMRTIIWVSGSCQICGTNFVSSNTTNRTCSSECAKSFRYEYKKKKQNMDRKTLDGRRKRRISKDRRRARQHNAYVGDVVRSQIYERDGDRCWICEEQTDPNVVVPHPNAPTIDHIIALAVGGTHEPKNCATACFRCNAIKGDRDVEFARERIGL